MLQWNYGCSFGLDIGRTNENYRVTDEVLFISPGPAMVHTSSTGMMIPTTIPSGSQVLMEFRMQYYPSDYYFLLTVEPKVDQYP